MVVEKIQSFYLCILYIHVTLAVYITDKFIIKKLRLRQIYP